MAIEVVEAQDPRRHLGLAVDVRIGPSAVSALRKRLRPMAQEGWKECACGQQDDGRIWLCLGLARPRDEWDRALSMLQGVFDRLSRRFGQAVRLDWQTRLLGEWEGLSGAAISLSQRWRAVPGVASGGLGPGVILVESGWAFGSGAHPSTRAAVKALEWLADRGHVAGRCVLDVGTGTGILAMLAARMGALSVLGLDTDPEALRWATHNIRQNGLEGQVAVSSTAVEAVPADVCDVVLANVAPSVLHCLSAALVARLGPGAFLVVAGFRPAGTEGLNQRMVSHGLRPLWTDSVSEWTGSIFFRP